MNKRYKAVQDYYVQHPDFVATLTTLSPDIQVLDWKRPNTSAYSLHAVFDHNRVYITGDLGSAVVELTEKATLETLSEYGRSPDYFAEKIKCATDMFAYDLDEAKDELETHLKRMMNRFCEEHPGNEDAVMDFRTKLDEIRDALVYRATTDRGLMEDCVAVRKLTEYDPYAEEWLSFAGRVIATRVLLWLAAFEWAWDYIESHSQEEQ